MTLVYLHNPRCSKSRQGLELLINEVVTVRDYLKDPLSENELKQLFGALNKKPIEVIRKKEAKELGLDNLSDSEWIQAISQHPILLERPILINGDKAIVGRPPELLLNIL